MKATRFEFRFRQAISAAMYLIGFWAPWLRFGPSAEATPTRLWSWLAIELARRGVLPVQATYLSITILAVLLAALGAALRIWGTAYLGRSVAFDKAMQAGEVVAAGPYRYARNPLYLGSMLTAIAASILMPVTGAAFFLVGITLFTLRLIGAEESFLGVHLGEDYAAYRNAVPSILPSVRSRLGVSSARPRWIQSLLAEVYPVGTAGCFATLAWSYDADLLTRCVIVCFGVSLVFRGLTASRGQTSAEVSQ